MNVTIERYLTINDSVLEWFYEVKKFPKLICSLDGKKLPMEVVHHSSEIRCLCLMKWPMPNAFYNLRAPQIFFRNVWDQKIDQDRTQDRCA